MEKKSYTLLWGGLGLVLLTILDQLTKYAACIFLKDCRSIEVIPEVFEFYYLENRGAAFGMLRNHQSFFIIIAALILAAAFFVYSRIPLQRKYLPLRLVCITVSAGALGNMLDRLLHNYVIDFLYFSLIDFPVFNVADCYVCIGILVLLILMFTYYKDDSFEFLFHGEKG
ncbi:MAG: signal peptidase II [Lachnospiraceae bacterium]|nr:signal peptidase II [Lachnospiraceae bacterium]